MVRQLAPFKRYETMCALLDFDESEFFRSPRLGLPCLYRIERIASILHHLKVHQSPETPMLQAAGPLRRAFSAQVKSLHGALSCPIKQGGPADAGQMQQAIKKAAALDRFSKPAPNLSDLGTLQPRKSEKFRPRESFLDKARLAEKPSVTPAVQCRLIKMRLVKHQTRNGKVACFSALVAAGNGAGGVGCGFGRDKKSSNAIMKAGKIAERHMEFFERFQGRTIFHPVTVKFKATLLLAKPGPACTGRRAHHTIQEICRVMGIDDISCKVYGSTNPLPVAEAFLEALRRQKTPEDVANDSGLKVADVIRVYEYGMATAFSQTLRKVYPKA